MGSKELQLFEELTSTELETINGGSEEWGISISGFVVNGYSVSWGGAASGMFVSAAAGALIGGVPGLVIGAIAGCATAALYDSF